MKDPKVKVAEIEAKKELTNHLFSLVTNPVLLSVAGFYLSDRLQGDYVIDPTSFQAGSHVLTGDKKWDPNAGKLNKGGALAMQVGLALFLGSVALKEMGATVQDIRGAIPLLRAAS